MSGPVAATDPQTTREQAVLGAALQFPEAISDCLDEGLAAADFADPGHGAIFAVMQGMHRRNEVPELTAVFLALQASGQHELAGGLQYLNQLQQFGLISGAGTRKYAGEIRQAALRRRAAEAAERLAGALRRPGVELDSELGDGIAGLQALLEQADARHPPFLRVAVADVLEAEPPAPSFWWGNLVPAGAVTLWSGHGGSAKSWVTLMLACAVALGRSLFGEPTRRGRALFYSGEDPGDIVRHRLHLICRAWGINPCELDSWLHVLDVTEADPVLFREGQAAGIRAATTTGAYHELQAHLKKHQVEVLIVDNASDAFDANEIDRTRVRAFMRALVKLIPRSGAVILLTHVDKASATSSRGAGDAYSGSTAWHNSARSRVAQKREADTGCIVLEHQKGNHSSGPLHEPIRLMWPVGGIPQEDEPQGGIVGVIARENDLRVVVRLIAEFNDRGELISIANTGSSCASSLLRDEPTFPKRLKPKDVVLLLRDAERLGYLEKGSHRTPDRKTRECWRATAEGRAMAGCAPVAPVAPIPIAGAQPGTGARTAPVAPVPGARGVGGLERAPFARNGVAL